jgi:hypothetical protein
MRRLAVLVAATALLAGGCGGDGAEAGRARWVGSWTLDRERSARAMVDFQLAELEEMNRTRGVDPFGGMGTGSPSGRRPKVDELLEQYRGFVKGFVGDVDLAADGSARADLYFSGAKVKYTGTWSEVGNGAEMKIVSKAEGVLQARDTIPVRFRREDQYLVVGGERDAEGKLKALEEVNTALVFRSFYLIRK